MNVLPPEKWRIINELGERFGVTAKAREKWKARGVPPVWQIKLVREAPGLLSFDDFDQKEKIANG
jgi:hypothetical protein